MTLKNKNGRVMDEIEYNDRFPWPIAADGSGATLAKINELGATADRINWRASLSNGGTPGDYNFTPPPGAPVAVASQAGTRRYFPFEGNAQDASGNNFNGVTERRGELSRAKRRPRLGAGQSLDCDGIDDFVQVSDPVQPAAYSISLWVKPDVIRAQNILARTDAARARPFHISCA